MSEDAVGKKPKGDAALYAYLMDLGKTLDRLDREYWARRRGTKPDEQDPK